MLLLLLLLCFPLEKEPLGITGAEAPAPGADSFSTAPEPQSFPAPFWGGRQAAKDSRGPLRGSEGWGVQVVSGETSSFENGSGSSGVPGSSGCARWGSGQGRANVLCQGETKGLLRREGLLCPAASEGLGKRQAELAGVEPWGWAALIFLPVPCLCLSC